MQNSQEALDNSLVILARSSLIVFIGIIFSKIATYVYRIIVARNFGTEIYGLFSLALMVSGFFAAIFSLGLQGGLLRYISFYRGKDEKEKIRYLLKFSLILTIPVSIAAGAILFFFSEFISLNFFHNPDLIIFLKWFAIFLPILLLGGIFHTVIRAYEKIGWFSFIGNILLTLVQLSSLLLLIFLGLKQNAVIFSYNLGFLAVFLVSFLICKSQLQEIFEKSRLEKANKRKLTQELLSYSWPIIFFGLVINVFSWIDSFTIGYYKTVSDVGIYNVALPLAFLLLTIPGLFLLLFLPLITKEYSRKNFSLISQLSKQIGKWIFILNLPLLILMILFPGAIINLLFRSEYIAAENSLRLLSIGIFFYSLSIVSENLLSMAGKSKTVLASLALASLTNIILNIILVPKWGIDGAAFSTMISYIFWGILIFFTGKHYTSIVPLKKKMIRIFLVALIPAALVFFIRKLIEITPFIAISLGIFFVLSYFALIIITKCFDENDLMIIRAIKDKIGIKDLKKP
jgi:O-antigen/teichoic acid export membrane protein